MRRSLFGILNAQGEEEEEEEVIKEEEESELGHCKIGDI